MSKKNLQKQFDEFDKLFLFQRNLNNKDMEMLKEEERRLQNPRSLQDRMHKEVFLQLFQLAQEEHKKSKLDDLDQSTTEMLEEEASRLSNPKSNQDKMHKKVFTELLQQTEEEVRLKKTRKTPASN